MSGDAGVSCRICGAANAVEAGRVEYLAGFDWQVWDCAKCGCRFTRHDGSLYERFHASGAISYYSDYRQFAAQCRIFFDLKNRQGLREFLCRTPKFRFIIERAAGEPAASRLLELGCSRGYLTSCFILEGRTVLGVDVSPEAIDSARAAFGDHFALAGSPEIASGRPYDFVYHVGMIGCVGDPMGLTRQLLAMLKPGGRLLFNAPNRAALHLRGQLWFDSAPPPDLVTLFPEGFWKRHFSSAAEVVEEVEMLPADDAVAVGLRTLRGRGWEKPLPLPPTGNRANSWTQQMGGGWRLFERIVLKFARLTGLATLAPQRPSEFGQFVQMTVR